MAQWKKVIVSGSRAHLVDVTASISITTANAIGFVGTASWAASASQAVSASYVTGSIFTGNNSALSASYAVTAAFAQNVSAPSFTVSASATGTIFNAAADTLTFTGSNGITASLSDVGSTTTITYGFPTNAQVQLGGVSGSFSGSFTGNITNADSASKVLTVTDATNADRFLTFVDSDNASAAAETVYTDAGIKYNPNTDLLTLSGDVAVNGGDITTTATTFNLLAGATSTINVGASTTNVNIVGSASIQGDLTVNGNATYINVTNLYVEDQYILLGSGSATNKPGGLVIQSSPAANLGYGLIYDSSTDRWYMQDSASALTGLGAITFSTTNGVVGVQYGQTAQRPNDATGPLYGGATNGWGNMWIDSDGTNDIWIYV